MFRPRLLIGLMAVMALIAGACGSDTVTETVTVTSIVEVEVPGETVTETVTVTSIVTEIVPGETIKFWSTETQPERLEITKGIIDRFTAASGISVDLTAADENNLPELMITNAASGTLPDVVFHPLDFTVLWADQGLLDQAAAAAVIDSLGRDTFAAGSIDLATYEGQPTAVPSDGWGQLLVYRKDLFDAAGLAAPDSFANIKAAAEALHDPANDMFGITAATKAGEVFTQQTFEQFALANGCNLFEGSDLGIGSEKCAEAVDFYVDLMRNYSPGGGQDVVTTRATYFAGQAAMIVWSPFILDEMAGLRDSAFPACDECAADPAFLASNSGIVTAFSGPSGAPAQYGQTSYMGIGTGANVPAAQAFIEFWLSEGYLDWLSTSPEGKFPMRRGNAANPTEYVDGWQTLETGVDRKAALSEFYPQATIDAIAAGADNAARWPIGVEQGILYTELQFPALIADLVASGGAAADKLADLVKDVMASIELATG
ncbi:MAG: extracellular solute-binding protein [bacterium]|nr:extracellular solute-binding protein [bacterium]